MNPFLNSKSAAWRGQSQESREDIPFSDSAASQGSSRTDHADMQNTPYPADSTDTQNSARFGGPNPQNPASGQSWMDNPALSGIDPARLQMLSSLAAQAQGKNQKELLSFLTTAASQTNTNGMSFQQDEIDAIISVLKIGKSPQEIQQMDRICALMRQFGAMRGRGRRH